MPLSRTNRPGAGQPPKTRIVILGSGFGGVTTARHLERLCKRRPRGTLSGLEDDGAGALSGACSGPHGLDRGPGMLAFVDPGYGPNRPELLTTLAARPWSWCLALPTLGGLAGVFRYLGRGRERAAFLSSCAFLLGVLAAAMAGSYPVWLRSTLDRANDLTSTNAASGCYALRAGLAWFVVGVSLAAAYFVLVFRIFRGKVALDEEGHSQ
jgi:hypothetical protein